MLLYNQITRINVHSSPLSRHDGSQSPRANTNFESLTSHVCLLAAGSILPGSLPMIRPKLITKCAATEKVQPVQKHFHSARQASTTRCITEAGFHNKTEPVHLLWGSGSEFVEKKTALCTPGRLRKDLQGTRLFPESLCFLTWKLVLFPTPKTTKTLLNVYTGICIFHQTGKLQGRLIITLYLLTLRVRRKCSMHLGLCLLLCLDAD